jgi:hypothetical protein
MKRTISNLISGLAVVLFFVACSVETESETALVPNISPDNLPVVDNPKVPVDLCENLACPACEVCDTGLCVPVANCETDCVADPAIVGMAAPYGRGTVNDMVVVEGVHYVASTVGLLTYDVSVPAEPKELGWLAMDGPAMAVHVEGERAYLAGGDSGLWIVDVSDPAEPTVLANDSIDGFVEGLTVAGGTVVLALGEDGLLWVDEASGDILGTLKLEGIVVDVTVHDDLVYAAAGAAGLLIVDPIEPTQPEIVATVAIPTGARAVQTVGNRAYVAASVSGGLRVIDISEPSLPVEMGGYFSGYPYSKYAVDVAVTPEGIAFVAAGFGGFRVVDLSDPAQFAVLASVDIGTTTAVHAWGDVVYLAGAGGIRTYDVSALDAPAELSQLHSGGFARGLAVAGNRAYVADLDGGLKILDVSSVDKPIVLASIGGFSPEAVDVVGHYAYAVSKRDENCWCTPGQLDIVDVSNPTNPVSVSTFDFNGFPSSVRVADGTAWIGTTYGNLVVVDVTNPVLPEKVTHIGGGYSFGTAEVAGNYVFASRRYYGLVVIDISDLSNPQVVAEIETPGYGSDLALDGNTVYMADGGGGLQIFDVTTPSSPTLIGSVSTPTAALQVAVRDGVAFVGQAHEVRFFDVSNPSQAIPMGALGVPGGAYDIVVDGEFAYVTGGDNLLTVINPGCGQ